jgi:NAD(P)H dehydrogenase (quinone)
MTKIAVVYHSGYGHTKKLAEAVHEGVSRAANAAADLIAVNAEGNITDDDWTTLDTADAIIFGSPTYMGTVSWQFKKFLDATSKRWYAQVWKEKIAAGFTNSGSMNGDKGITMSFLIAFAMQHGMAWVGTGLMPSASKSAQRNDVNYLGSSSGLYAQSPSDASPDEGPLPGDLETARLFGKHIADTTQKFKKHP